MVSINDDTSYARELFARYADALDGDFKDGTAAQNVHLRCIAIAEELLALGFTIRSQSSYASETVPVADDTVRTIITFKYRLALLHGSREPQEPLAVSTPISRVFGPETIPTIPVSSPRKITAEDEIYLRSVLDTLGETDRNVPE